MTLLCDAWMYERPEQFTYATSTNALSHKQIRNLLHDDSNHLVTYYNDYGNHGHWWKPLKPGSFIEKN